MQTAQRKNYSITTDNSLVLARVALELNQKHGQTVYRGSILNTLVDLLNKNAEVYQLVEQKIIGKHGK